MSFIAHEYFHHFNVKRIRPIALGPFDYDRENYTKMLWVSEGFTVYYEDQVLLRSGFYTPEEYLERLGTGHRRPRERPGHRFKSAGRVELRRLERLLRSERAPARTRRSPTTTRAASSRAAARLRDPARDEEPEVARRRDADALPDLLQGEEAGLHGRGVPRGLRRQSAGVSLAEIFDRYASTTAEIDYKKYFAWAGLEIDVEAREQPGASLGAETEERDGALVISRVEPDSPASEAGLMIEDEILAFDTVRVTGRKLNEILESRKPGEKVRVLIARRGRTREIDVVPAKKTERTFRITPMKNPDPREAAILMDWLPSRKSDRP